MNIEFTVSVQYLIKSDKWLWEVVHSINVDPYFDLWANFHLYSWFLNVFNYTKKYAYYTYFLCTKQTKDYEIGICCFSDEYTTWRSKSRYGLAWNQCVQISVYSPFDQPKTGLKNLLKINSSTYWFIFFTHLLIYHLPTLDK